LSINQTTKQPQGQPISSPAPLGPNTTGAIIYALVILVVVGVVGIILAAVLLPNNTTLILQVLGVIIPTTGALLAYLKSTGNEAKIQAIHVDVNSRLTELLATQGDAEHAKGVIQGAEALSLRQGVDTLAASVEAANVAKAAAETAREAALQVTQAAEKAAAALAAAMPAFAADTHAVAAAAQPEENHNKP
jgi:hypothetical protein